jgi:hypothetical protein
MAGLDPAIYVLAECEEDVDARDKRGHDELKRPPLISEASPPCRFV